MADSVKYSDAAKGHPSQVMSTIRRKVSALARWNSGIYIGKTSGRYGLAERFNNKYKKLGFHEIVAVYESSSVDYADKVEALIIKYARKKFKRKVKNVIGGGGGPDGDGIRKIVYVATMK